ncbi:MAG: HEAT repeat domain-containing protein, partial [Abitibacteriaceae bacterium]|nr:HEAT repeat domain-containing protein [Abditibacteriaceae bacterium]
DLPTLLNIVATKPAEERSGVLDAVAEIARRGTDENQRTGAILTQLAKANNPALKADLLTVLGQVGGSRALTTLRKSLADPAPEVRLAALRRVAEWPTDEPLQDLLRIVRNTPDEKQRAIALRGYIRMIGLGEQRSPEASVALLQQVSDLTKSLDSKRLVLAGLAHLKSQAALDYAATFLTDKSVQPEAEATLVEIGQGTVGAWRDKTRAALQPLAQGATDEAVRKRASEVLALSDKFGDFIMAWQVSPAYQSAGANWQKLFDMPFAPEQPEHQKEVSWRLMPVGTNAEQPWLLDLLALWGGEQKVAYLRTEVWSDTARDAVLELGSDDGVKVWCNGQVVFADNTQRAVAPGQDKVTVRLKPGSNQLMLKITQNVLGWGACARFTNPDGSAVNGLRYTVPTDASAAHPGAI